MVIIKKLIYCINRNFKVEQFVPLITIGKMRSFFGSKKEKEREYSGFMGDTSPE